MRRESLLGWLRPSFGRQFAVAASIVMVALGALAWGGLRWADSWAVSEGSRAAEQMAHTHAGLFASELEKYRLLPLVLTEYPEVRAALVRHSDREGQVSAKLQLLAERTNAAVIYALDERGIAIAASNARLPTSFVGHDYRFRSYFQEALAKGHAEQFALGAVTHRPGLFLAREVVDGRRPVGVIVVKVEFDRIEGQWRSESGSTVVVNARGAVLLTSQPRWRFRTLAWTAVSSGRGAGAPLVEDEAGNRMVAAALPVPVPGWVLHHLEPLERYEATPVALVRELMFAAAIVLVVIVGLVLRAHERRALREESRHYLEAEVERRTAELRESNDRLRIESGERQRSEERLRAAREELAQANRLSIIGQITAGVAHEVNQPVAAIRTFADNALRFLSRSESLRASRSLASIVELTERIGRITTELRLFARRSTPSMSAVPLASAIDGALLLMGDRIRNAETVINRPILNEEVLVVGDRTRLEQILVNLLQNALDAVAKVPSPQIAIEVALGSRVQLTISDNGPGVSAELTDTLFTPFVTGKPDGLGLGLGIAREIAREFGGDISFGASGDGGAAFTLTLRNPESV